MTALAPGAIYTAPPPAKDDKDLGKDDKDSGKKSLGELTGLPSLPPSKLLLGSGMCGYSFKLLTSFFSRQSPRLHFDQNK